MSALPRPPSVYPRALALAAHLALIVLLMALLRSPLALAAALLLFLPLPGMLRGRRYTHAWASMLLVGYCALLLANGYAQPQARALMFGLAALAAADFVGLVLYVRISAREARGAAAAA
ncbi:DUF2069 domain-containing protein [Solimonas variicoloris]|uniref:DUF2069 domain-containing protein n=1 Tax=Solimonas variicoloris TaxID=254408 RepID=UPI00036EEC1A|nr:DUF2069 domain-containing protein [Solimonas variicoloris]